MRLKTRLPISLVGFFISIQLNAQTPVNVAEGTLKVGIASDGILYFGFAAGDKMIFNFEETNGKELKEVVISQESFGILLQETKTSKITNRTIPIVYTGIIKFKFSNTSVLPKNCKYKIQRIPASEETINFNTTVYNDPVYDTTYVDEVQEYLEKIDTIVITYQDRNIRVNPSTVAGGNKATFGFVLPENIIGWSYYISTGKESTQAYADANKNFISANAQDVSRYRNYNILAAMVLKKNAAIPKLNSGPAINYWVMDPDNESLFSSGAKFKSIKNGKAVNDYAVMAPQEGNMSFAFLNDSATDALTVSVKITSVQANEIWKKKVTPRMRVTLKSTMHLKN